MSLAGAALFCASYFLPWWRLWLFAPQYPKGLEVGISLTGVGGDVRELNILNHYIGMKPLDLAALTERRFAAQGVGLVAALGVVLTLVTGRRVGWVVAALGIVFPLTFVIDSQYWLFHFGHTLNPHAPIRLPPFTPQMFGTGQIGQFMTFARPDPGFWVAIGCVACLVGAAILRKRVCDHCARAKSCGLVCPSAFVGPHAGLPKE
ncbi:MAG: cytochrome C [Polyangiales bacterium]